MKSLTVLTLFACVIFSANAFAGPTGWIVLENWIDNASEKSTESPVIDVGDEDQDVAGEISDGNDDDYVDEDDVDDDDDDEGDNNDDDDDDDDDDEDDDDEDDKDNDDYDEDDDNDDDDVAQDFDDDDEDDDDDDEDDDDDGDDDDDDEDDYDDDEFGQRHHRRHHGRRGNCLKRCKKAVVECKKRGGRWRCFKVFRRCMKRCAGGGTGPRPFPRMCGIRCTFSLFKCLRSNSSSKAECFQQFKDCVLECRKNCSRNATFPVQECKKNCSEEFFECLKSEKGSFMCWKKKALCASKCESERKRPTRPVPTRTPRPIQNIKLCIKNCTQHTPSCEGFWGCNIKKIRMMKSCMETCKKIQPNPFYVKKGRLGRLGRLQHGGKQLIQRVKQFSMMKNGALRAKKGRYMKSMKGHFGKRNFGNGFHFG